MDSQQTRRRRRKFVQTMRQFKSKHNDWFLPQLEIATRTEHQVFKWTDEGRRGSRALLENARNHLSTQVDIAMNIDKNPMQQPDAVTELSKTELCVWLMFCKETFSYWEIAKAADNAVEDRRHQTREAQEFIEPAKYTTDSSPQPSAAAKGLDLVAEYGKTKKATVHPPLEFTPDKASSETILSEVYAGRAETKPLVSGDTYPDKGKTNR